MIEELKGRLSHYWQLLNRSIPPLGISLLLHLLLIVAVVAAGITTFEKKPVARTTAPVIQAHAVDGAQLRARAEQKRKKAEAEKQAKQKAKRRAEEKRKEKARKKKEKAKKEKAKKAKAKKEKAKKAKAKKAKAKKAKARKEKAKREKAKKEKARKAREKKKKEAARKKREKEKKRKATEKKRAEKRKAEANRKKRQEQQMLLDAELEMEQLLRAGRAGGGDRERSRLQSQIRQQIEGVWRKPPGTPVGRSCKVKVRLLSDGGVGRITMITRSGNEAFDLSVGQAIYEAAPFPLPESVELRREVSELEMIFVHEG